MTQGKKFKKAVRERMAVTGESYTAARRVLEQQRGRGDPLGIVDDPGLWSAAGGDEQERREVQGDMRTYERVKQLCREIHERHALSSRHATDDPAFHELVALGPDGIPALLRRLQDFKESGGHHDGLAVWEPIIALHRITGIDPTPAHGVVVEDGFVKSHLPTLLDTWLDWGRAEGHR